MTLRQWLQIDFALTKCMSAKKLAATWNKYYEPKITQEEVIMIMEELDK